MKFKEKQIYLYSNLAQHFKKKKKGGKSNPQGQKQQQIQKQGKGGQQQKGQQQPRGQQQQGQRGQQQQGQRGQRGQQQQVQQQGQQQQVQQQQVQQQGQRGRRRRRRQRGQQQGQQQQPVNLPSISKVKAQKTSIEKSLYDQFINHVYDSYNSLKEKLISTLAGGDFLTFWQPFDKDSAIEDKKILVSFDYNVMFIQALLSLTGLSSNKQGGVISVSDPLISKIAKNIVKTIGKFIKAKYPTIPKLSHTDRLDNLCTYYTVRAINAVAFVILFFVFLQNRNNYDYFEYRVSIVEDFEKLNLLKNNIKNIMDKNDVTNDMILHLYKISPKSEIKDVQYGSIGNFHEYFTFYDFYSNSNELYLRLLVFDYGDVNWEDVEDGKYDNFIYECMRMFNEASILKSNKIDKSVISYIDYYSNNENFKKILSKKLSDYEFYSFRIPYYQKEIIGYLMTISEMPSEMMEMVSDVIVSIIYKFKNYKGFIFYDNAKIKVINAGSGGKYLDKEESLYIIMRFN